jgi:hypothetical protein
MAGQFHRIGKAVFDQAAFGRAEQLSQWVAQGNRGYLVKKLREGHCFAP